MLPTQRNPASINVDPPDAPASSSRAVRTVVQRNDAGNSNAETNALNALPVPLTGKTPTLNGAQPTIYDEQPRNTHPPIHQTHKQTSKQTNQPAKHASKKASTQVSDRQVYTTSMRTGTCSPEKTRWSRPKAQNAISAWAALKQERAPRERRQEMRRESARIGHKAVVQTTWGDRDAT